MSLDGSPAEQLFSYAVATLLVFSADSAELDSFFGVQ